MGCRCNGASGFRAIRLAPILVICVLAAGQPAGTRPAIAQEVQPKLEVAEGRFLVLLADSFSESSEMTAAEYDRRSGVEIDLVYDTVFRGFAGEFSDSEAMRLLTDPRVAGVYPDYLVRAQVQSLEPGIDRVDADMNATKAGNGSGSVDIDVAVIDSGVGPNNDLTIAGGYNCMGDGYLRDYYGHGTHVAGIIGAKDNSYGVVGVAPGARIWSVRVLDRYGGGTWSQIICGMEWVAENADIIEVANMSLGAGNPEYGSGCTSSPAHRAVCAMTGAGVTVMAAACNANSDASTCTPGKYPEVISVSAFAEWDGKPGGKGGCKSTPDGFYGCDDRRASFSNYGPTVDIAAIGVGVRSTLFDNRYGYWSGTSMATPHVTGAAALLLANEPNLSPARVRDRLLLAGMSGPVPGDPDAYPEPILNVASLGKGTIDVPASTKPGDVIKLKAGELIPRTKATYRINDVLLGEDSINLSGASGLTITVPDLPYGRYEVEVSNHRKTLRDTILIRPKVTLGSSSGVVSQSVTVSLAGYGAGESVLVTFGTGAGVRSVLRVQVSNNGSGNGQFVVPASTRGSHRVTATDRSGHTTYAHFAVSATLTAGSPVEAGAWLPVSMRGFQANEVVELRWGSSTGRVLRAKTTSATGSGDVNVQIPADTTPGGHSLWAIGDHGTRVRVTVNTIGPAEDPTPVATPTVTATLVPDVTATVVASETPAATVTSAPTVTATSEIDVATEVPTEVPPTESRTPEGTVETPVEATPTSSPDQVIVVTTTATG